MIDLWRSRFWTSLAVGALAAVAIAQGTTMVRFALTELSGDTGNTAEKFASFVDDRLVGDVATRDMLRLSPRAAPESVTAKVGDLLAKTPLSSGAWLDLAIARRAAGASTDSVAAALALSTITGPNEEGMMAGRAAFALPFWSALPQDKRRALIADLVGGWAAMDEPGRERIVALVENAPDGSGAEVRAALLLAGARASAAAKALLSPANAGAPQ